MTRTLPVASSTGSPSIIEIANPGFEIPVLEDDTIINSADVTNPVEVIGVDNNNLTITEGNFGKATVSFTAAAGDSFVGKKLGIRLINLNTAEGQEVDFDNVSLKAESVVANAITENQTLFGSNGEVLNGGQGDDILYSNGLSTEIFGRDGNDWISGSSNDEYIVGGADNDTLLGNSGKDTLYGDAGDDLIYGGCQADTIFGGAGNDTIFGNGGGDFINTGTGLDTVFLGSGADTIALEKGEGFDTVHNFQLGSSQFFVGSLRADLTFTDSDAGVRISAGDDLLAIVSGQSASTFSSDIDRIFV
jgi:Ca2+-binding RTX toxin-like protein